MKTSIIPLLLLLWACSPSGKFDSDRWKNADLLTRDRIEMMDELLSQHALKGLDRSDVIELLGELTVTDKWEDWDMIYVLGPTEYMPIDNEWFVIKLDKNGRVVAYKVTQD